MMKKKPKKKQKKDNNYNYENVTSYQINNWIKSKNPQTQKKALDSIFERIKNQLSALISRKKLDNEYVEDALQETYISIWNKVVVRREEFTDKDAVFAYAYKTCKNILLKRSKKIKIELPTDHTFTEYDNDGKISPFNRDAGGKRVDDMLSKTSLMFKVIEELDKKYDKKHGETFRLKMIGFNNKDIAEKLEIEVDYVRQIIYRLKEKLRNILGDELDDFL